MKREDLTGLLGDGRAEPSDAAGLLSGAQQPELIAPSEFVEALAELMSAHHKLKTMATKKAAPPPGLLG